MQIAELKIGKYTFMVQLEGQTLTILAAPIPIEQEYIAQNPEINFRNIEDFNWGKNENN